MTSRAGGHDLECVEPAIARRGLANIAVHDGAGCGGRGPRCRGNWGGCARPARGRLRCGDFGQRDHVTRWARGHFARRRRLLTKIGFHNFSFEGNSRRRVLCGTWTTQAGLALGYGFNRDSKHRHGDESSYKHNKFLKTILVDTILDAKLPSPHRPACLSAPGPWSNEQLQTNAGGPS